MRDEYQPALSAHLDHVDALIADGVLSGERPNVADFQIASSVRLLMALDDLRPMIAARPCGEHAVNLMPQYPGHVPAGAVAVA